MISNFLAVGHFWPEWIDWDKMIVLFFIDHWALFRNHQCNGNFNGITHTHAHIIVFNMTNPRSDFMLETDSVSHLHYPIYYHTELAHHNLYVSVIRRQLRTLAHEPNKQTICRRITYFIWVRRIQPSKRNKINSFHCAHSALFLPIVENQYVHKPNVSLSFVHVYVCEWSMWAWELHSPRIQCAITAQ